MRIKLLLACAAILLGGSSSAPTIAAAETSGTTNKDYVDFNGINDSAYSTITINPENELPLNGVNNNSFASSYSQELEDFKYKLVTRVDKIDDHYVTIANQNTSDTNCITIENISRLMNFSFTFSFTREYLLDIFDNTTITAITLTVHKYCYPPFFNDVVESVTFNDDSLLDLTMDSMKIDFNTQYAANYNSNNIEVRWAYTHTSTTNQTQTQYVPFKNFSLQYARFDEIMPAVTYDGIELVDRALSSHTDDTFIYEDYYHISRSTKYISETDSVVLRDLTIVFGQEASLRTNYLVHVDFYSDLFTNAMARYISLSCESWDGTYLETRTMISNAQYGINFVIPFQYECHVIITTGQYSPAGVFYDNSSLLKSISIIPYSLRDHLGDNQLFYFGTTELGVNLEDANNYALGYEDGYENGREEGNEEGFDKGVESGYSSGFQTGKEFGYDSGYQEGKKENYNWWTAFMDWWYDLWNSIQSLFVKESE